jgi:hypothetical protein
MAAGDDNINDMDAVDYEYLMLYHLYIGNHFDRQYQECLKNQEELSATVPSQQQQPHSGNSQTPPETPKDHPTSREFEKMCHAIADPACERLAAETRQNVKLIEPRTLHTYHYKDAKTGEMVEKGIKPDMIVAFSHDGVRGKNVVVDAKSHKGAIAMKDYDKLERDRSVTKVRKFEVSVKGLRLCFSAVESYSPTIRFSAHTLFFLSIRTVKYRLLCSKQLKRTIVWISFATTANSPILPPRNLWIKLVLTSLVPLSEQTTIVTNRTDLTFKNLIL